MRIIMLHSSCLLRSDMVNGTSVVAYKSLSELGKCNEGAKSTSYGTEQNKYTSSTEMSHLGNTTAQFHGNKASSLDFAKENWHMTAPTPYLEMMSEQQ